MKNYTFRKTFTIAFMAAFLFSAVSVPVAHADYYGDDYSYSYDTYDSFDSYYGDTDYGYSSYDSYDNSYYGDDYSYGYYDNSDYNYDVGAYDNSYNDDSYYGDDFSYDYVDTYSNDDAGYYYGDDYSYDYSTPAYDDSYYGDDYSYAYDESSSDDYYYGDDYSYSYDASDNDYYGDDYAYSYDSSDGYYYGDDYAYSYDSSDDAYYGDDYAYAYNYDDSGYYGDDYDYSYGSGYDNGYYGYGYGTPATYSYNDGSYGCGSNCYDYGYGYDDYYDDYYQYDDCYYSYYGCGGSTGSGDYYYNGGSTVVNNNNNNTNNNNNVVNIGDDDDEDEDLEVVCRPSDSSVEEGDTVIWTADVDGGSSSNYTYTWSGTDGLFGSARSISKQYHSEGTKRATVTVRSGNETKSADCLTHVEEEDEDDDDDDHDDLEVVCRPSDSRVEEGDTVVWTATVDGGSSSNYSYDWSGTDGLYGSARSISKQYYSDGTKRATVTVRSGNETESADCTTYVEEEEDDDDDDDDLRAICRVSDTSIEEGDRVTFEVEIDGGNSPYEIDWNGDISGDDEKETVRFSREGRYEVSVTVEDDDGNRDTDDCSVVRVSEEDDDDDDDDDDRVTVISNTQPPRSTPSQASVYLSQVPYTGAGEVATFFALVLAALGIAGSMVYRNAKKNSKATRAQAIEAFKQANIAGRTQ